MSGSLFRKHTLGRKSKGDGSPVEATSYEIVLERFNAWKDVTKQLVVYFEGLAEVEANSAKHVSKLAGVIHTPFRPGNHFMEKDGLQTIFDSVREKTHLISEQHANFSRTITANIVKHVQNLREDIKIHIKDVENEVGKLQSRLEKEREQSKKLISDLATAITTLKTNPDSVTAEKDPYIVNAHVRHQLQKQIHNENLLQKAIIIMQQNSEKIEGNVVDGIQSAWKSLEEWEAKKSKSITDLQMAMATEFGGLARDAEWNDFQVRKKDTLLDPNTPLRDEEALKYPSMDDAEVLPEHKGMMERKKRYTRTYRDSFYVLSPAGYLHEYPSSDPSAAPQPLFSLFLPSCTLGAPSSDSSKSHKFNLEEGQNKNSKGSSLRGTLKLGKSDSHAWSFKINNRNEMTEWWEAIRPHCARHLQAVDADAKGKATAATAVKNVGIKEEEEAEEEEERSSGEYEDDNASRPPDYPASETDPGFAGVGAYTDDKKVAVPDPIEEAAATGSAPDTDHKKEASSPTSPTATSPTEKEAAAVSHEREGSKFKEDV